MARTKNNRNVAPYSMKGFPAHATTSPLTNDEPDWSKMNISATGDNSNIDTSEFDSTSWKLTPEQEKFKQEYPELWAARNDPDKSSWDFTLKERLQSIQHGMGKAKKYDPTGFADVIGTAAGVAEGTKNIKDLGKSTVNVIGGKLKTGKKIIDKSTKAIGTANNLYKNLNKNDEDKEEVT
jgi:hypothetical protein